MNWLQGFLFGLLSGFSEVLPLSSGAHRLLFGELLGVPSDDPVMMIFVHTAILFALYFGFQPFIEQIKRSQSTLRRTAGRKRQNHTIADVRFVKNAFTPLIICIFIISYVLPSRMPMPLVSVFLLVNGLILYLPQRLISANKDAGAMSILDSWLIGISSALISIPGFSGVGIAASAAIFRGGDRQKATNWALFLLIPALFASLCVDVISIFSYPGSISFFSGLAGYLLASIGAFISGYLAIKLVKILTARSSYSGFAYYSWGMALFIFLLYLTVV